MRVSITCPISRGVRFLIGLLLSRWHRSIIPLVIPITLRGGISRRWCVAIYSGSCLIDIRIAVGLGLIVT